MRSRVIVSSLSFAALIGALGMARSAAAATFVGSQFQINSYTTQS